MTSATKASDTSAAGASSTVLVVEDLSTSYGDHRAVDQVSFTSITMLAQAARQAAPEGTVLTALLPPEPPEPERTESLPAADAAPAEGDAP